MSKVNVDEIQVGDLVGFEDYKGEIIIGYVTNIEVKQGGKQFWGHFSSSHDPNRKEFLHDFSVDYHWKVINFEEKTKMDELKVYTGKETLQALMDGKTLRWATDQYKLEGEFLHEKNGTNEWDRSFRSLDHFMNNEFTEVVTPQVGDWVKVYLPDKTIAGEITEISDLAVRIEDNLVSLKHYWEILSPEQASEYKREQAFIKVGRKLNEFRSGDIVLIESTGDIAVVVSKENEKSIRLHVLNVERKGYDGKPTQLKPIAFTEQQVDLS